MRSTASSYRWTRLAALLAVGTLAGSAAVAQDGRGAHEHLDRVLLQVGRLDNAIIQQENPVDPTFVSGAGSLGGRGTSGTSGGSAQPVPQSGGPVTPFGAGDTDGDGLTDGEELAGWDIVIDEQGYGPIAVGSFMTIRHVTSNYLVADSDGDGLDDHEEWLIGSDPGDDDTDGDALDDEAEWNTWFTSLNSVDSDGDARGPDANLPPNVSLFDGFELDPSTPRTSPTLDDTDGDGRTDFEEFDHPFFSPLISELPTAAITVEGTMDVRLDVEYAESVVQEKAYETSFSLSNSVTKGKESTSSQSQTLGWSTEVTIGFEETVGVEAGVPPSASGEVTASQEFSVGAHGEVTKEKSFTVSQETSQTAEQTSTEYISDSNEFTETASTGSITLPIRVENDSDFAYTLTNLGVTLLSFEPDSTGATPGIYRSMGTIVPDLDAFTLAPGETTPILNLDSGDLNADIVKDFLANPSTLILQPAIFDMQNEDGVDFDFITENTFSQTALVEIDFGGGDVDIYRIATNVNRSGFDYLGVTMAEVMTDILGIAYTVQDRVDGSGTVLVGSDDDGNTGDVQVLTSIEGVASIYDEGAGTVTSFWSVATDADLGHALVADLNGTPVTDFESIRLFAGDSVRLVYDEDQDGDGLWASQERAYGTSDANTDSDADGLSDFVEVIKGWEAPLGSGHYVYSDPRNPDTDFDGRGDLGERNGHTDPQNPDTDGDGLFDGVDPSPKNPGLNLRVAPVASGAADGSSWDDAMTLVDAVAAAETANSNGVGSDDVIAIWLHQGAYELDAEITLPTGNVSLFGGFTDNDLKLGDRDSDPTTNQTTLLPSATGIANGVSLLRVDELNAGTEAGALDGFVVTGMANTALRAIHVAEGRVTLRNMLFVGNHCQFSTIGIFNEGSVTAENCEFLLNTSDTGGAAVLDGGKKESQWTDCRFSLNNASTKGGAYRRLEPSTPANNELKPSFTRCTFFSNQVYYDGTADIGLHGGGAVYTADGGTFIDCDFFGNQTGSTKADNDYKYGFHALKGGAIAYSPEAAYDCQLTLVNCRFFDNLSGPGGAVFVSKIHDTSHVRALNVVNCTMVRNTCLKLDDDNGVPDIEQGAGGLHVNNSQGTLGSGVVVIRNSLITKNASFGKLNSSGISAGSKRRANIKIEGFNPINVDLAFCTIEGIYDDANGNYAGGANTDDDPLFVQEAAGNLRLQSGSPVIDFGVNAVDIDLSDPIYQPLPATDLDGLPRIVEGDGFGSATVDRGAYEYQP